MSELNNRYLVVGGGTGGHTYPAWRVAKKLKKLNYDVWFITDDQSLKKEAKNLQINFIYINSGKIIRSVLPKYWFKNFSNLLKTSKTFASLFIKIKKINPRVIFSKGGYISFPVCLCARFMQIPIVLHESDAVMGFTNKYFAQDAKKICVGFPERYYPAKYKSKLVYTSIPLEEDFSPVELPKNNKKILIIGGSQGSQPINELFLRVLPLLDNYEITWITGKNNYKNLKERIAANGAINSKIKLIDYSDEVAKLMKENYIIISRSGSTIMEISAIGRPSILIPFADSAGDHQDVNAKIFCSDNAAKYFHQDDSPEKLFEIINEIKKVKNAQALAKNIKKFYKKESIDLIVKEILAW